ncbi:alpha/beta hydrolase [Tomitella gaofuii]|uniref:alpha/beta hydrolase n=1 Tax=Tomitella gaofuii TaxID=2760083 RepID=UPI0015FB7B2E|nr:alpha/beta hydrolase family protein [Tomitella gaofuii]
MSRSKSSRLRRFVVGSAAAALIAGVMPVALGGAVANAAEAAHVDMDQSSKVGPQEYELEVYSPSMQRNIQLKVLAPANADVLTPVLYLLNGAGGGEDSANWTDQSDVDAFFKDKQTYVVIPQEGAFSYYTDWIRPDPALAKNLGNNGINMWQTFLTEELPPVMNSFLPNASGKNGLAGISMSGSSVLDLAIQAPELYSAVGAYSGCAMTSDPVGSSFVNLVTAAGGANSANMWGPVGGPLWVEHDPYVNAAKLPRIPIFISSGSGLPGVHDQLGDPRIAGNMGKLAGQMITGGAIEAATSACTHMLQLRTDSLGMDNIHYDFPVGGTHSWGYWQDDLHQSWPMLAAGMGVQ